MLQNPWIYKPIGDLHFLGTISIRITNGTPIPATPIPTRNRRPKSMRKPVEAAERSPKKTVVDKE